jgi:hypothetical protein
LYKLQIYNALTQELVREKMFKKPDHILSLLDSAEKGQVCFIFDEDCRTYQGTYVSHTIFNLNDFVVYKIVFELELSEIQARVLK